MKPLWIAVALAGSVMPAVGADLSFQRRQSERRDDRARAGQSVGPRLSARRTHARHRASRPLRIVTRDGKLSQPLAGVPPVRASGQGGLHDVVLDRDFASNKTIYFCYAEPASGGGRTAMARARLDEAKRRSSTT